MQTIKDIITIIGKLISYLCIFILNLYRNTVSPLLPSSCRFYPSCSAYALQAFKEHGFARGLLLTSGRIIRCNPFNAGGHDPVPRKTDLL